VHLQIDKNRCTQRFTTKEESPPFSCKTQFDVWKLTFKMHSWEIAHPHKSLLYNVYRFIFLINTCNNIKENDNDNNFMATFIKL
jgi:hypothetical protein